MTIAFKCQCGRELLVEDKHAGRKGKCPYCGMDVKIPGAPLVTPPPAPPPSDGIDLVREDEEEARLEREYAELLARVAKFPGEAEPYVQLGHNCFKRGKMTLALDAYRRALLIDETLVDLLSRIEAIGGPKALAQIRAELDGRETEEETNLPSFFEAFAAAWLVPLRGQNLGLLLVGVLFLVVVRFVFFVVAYSPFFIMGLVVRVCMVAFACSFMATYCRDVMLAAAAGERTLPDWPEVGRDGASLVEALKLIGVPLGLTWGLALLAWIVLGAEHTAIRVAIVVLCAVYFPASIMATCLIGHVAAMSLLLVFRAILQMGWQYALVAPVAQGLLFLAIRSLPLLRATGFHMAILDVVLAMAVSLYCFLVGFSLLGGLYWTNREKVGWLS